MVTFAKVETHDSTDAVSIYESSNPSVLEKVRSLAESAKDKFSLRSVRATGPARFFNPTNIRMRVEWTDREHAHDPGADMAILWRSRDNRKGRNSIAVPRAAATRPSLQFPDGPPRFSSSLVQVSKGIVHVFTRFMYWDMAFWVAFWFTLGSAVYVANGVFTWLPVAYPDSYPPADSKMTEGLTAFFGVVFYEIGAILAYLEAINAGTFHGSAMRRFLEGHQDGQKKLVDEKLQSFFQSMVPAIVRGSKRVSSAATRMEYEIKLRETVRRNRRDSAWKGLAYRRHALDLGVEQGTLKEYSRFRWLPTWKNFKEHHVYEIGFLACAIQLLGATIFLVPGLTILPGVYDHMNKHEQIGAYWIPDIVGSTLFIVSSLLFTLETQEKWYRPQVRVVGWWIGFWAVVGSVGFELAAALGPASYSSHAANYQLGLSSTWSSACFVISTLLQWYEAVNKNVIEELDQTQSARPIPHPI